MNKEQALIKVDLLKNAIETLPDGAEILDVTIDWQQKYDQILLAHTGSVSESEVTETKVNSSGELSKIALISGFRVKWYSKEGDE